MSLPIGDRGRFAPVTAAVGHEHSSLRSSGDGHRTPMPFSHAFYHAAHQRSIGGLIIDKRFYPPLRIWAVLGRFAPVTAVLNHN